MAVDGEQNRPETSSAAARSASAAHWRDARGFAASISSIAIGLVT